MASIDAGYHAWNAEFPLRELFTLDDYVAAQNAYRACEAIPRDRRTDGQELYLGGLRCLISAFERGYYKHLAANGETDRTVLRYLLAWGGYHETDADLLRLAKRVNYPDTNLKSVLAGTNELCREGMAKLARHFKVGTEIFDSSLRLGKTTRHRRFWVYDGAGGLTIQDRETKQEAEVGEVEVAIGDEEGNTFLLDPDGLGYREEFEAQCNANVEQTLAAFFPKVFKEIRDKKAEELTALRKLNSGRRMFYVLNHDDTAEGEELMIAQAGDERTHEEWHPFLDVSHRRGWHEHVRGAYYPQAKLLLFYVGEEHTTNEHVKHTAYRWLEKVAHALGLEPGVRVGLGAVAGQPGTVWEPMVDLGTLQHVRETLALCA